MSGYSSDETDPTVWFPCKFCERAFQSKTELLLHRIKNHVVELREYKERKRNSGIGMNKDKGGQSKIDGDFETASQPIEEELFLTKTPVKSWDQLKTLIVEKKNHNEAPEANTSSETIKPITILEAVSVPTIATIIKVEDSIAVNQSPVNSNTGSMDQVEISEINSEIPDPAKVTRTISSVSTTESTHDQNQNQDFDLDRLDMDVDVDNSESESQNLPVKQVRRRKSQPRKIKIRFPTVKNHGNLDARASPEKEKVQQVNPESSSSKANPQSEKPKTVNMNQDCCTSQDDSPATIKDVSVCMVKLTQDEITSYRISSGEGSDKANNSNDLPESCEKLSEPEVETESTNNPPTATVSGERFRTTRRLSKTICSKKNKTIDDIFLHQISESQPIASPPKSPLSQDQDTVSVTAVQPMTITLKSKDVQNTHTLVCKDQEFLSDESTANNAHNHNNNNSISREFEIEMIPDSEIFVFLENLTASEIKSATKRKKSSKPKSSKRRKIKKSSLSSQPIQPGSSKNSSFSTNNEPDKADGIKTPKQLSPKMSVPHETESVAADRKNDKCKDQVEISIESTQEETHENHLESVLSKESIVCSKSLVELASSLVLVSVPGPKASILPTEENSDSISSKILQSVSRVESILSSVDPSTLTPINEFTSPSTPDISPLLLDISSPKIKLTSPSKPGSNPNPMVKVVLASPLQNQNRQSQSQSQTGNPKYKLVSPSRHDSNPKVQLVSRSLPQFKHKVKDKVTSHHSEHGNEPESPSVSDPCPGSGPVQDSATELTSSSISSANANHSLILASLLVPVSSAPVLDPVPDPDPKVDLAAVPVLDSEPVAAVQSQSVQVSVPPLDSNQETQPSILPSTSGALTKDSESVIPLISHLDLNSLDKLTVKDTSVPEVDFNVSVNSAGQSTSHLVKDTTPILESLLHSAKDSNLTSKLPRISNLHVEPASQLPPVLNPDPQKIMPIIIQASQKIVPIPTLDLNILKRQLQSQSFRRTYNQSDNIPTGNVNKGMRNKNKGAISKQNLTRKTTKSITLHSPRQPLSSDKPQTSTQNQNAARAALPIIFQTSNSDSILRRRCSSIGLPLSFPEKPKKVSPVFAGINLPGKKKNDIVHSRSAIIIANEGSHNNTPVSHFSLQLPRSRPTSRPQSLLKNISFQPQYYGKETIQRNRCSSVPAEPGQGAYRITDSELSLKTGEEITPLDLSVAGTKTMTKSPCTNLDLPNLVPPQDCSEDFSLLPLDLSTSRKKQCFKCENCTLVFSSEEELSTHNSSEHQCHSIRREAVIPVPDPVPAITTESKDEKQHQQNGKGNLALKFSFTFQSTSNSVPTEPRSFDIKVDVPIKRVNSDEIETETPTITCNPSPMENTNTNTNLNITLNSESDNNSLHLDASEKQLLSDNRITEKVKCIRIGCSSSLTPSSKTSSANEKGPGSHISVSNESPKICVIESEVKETEVEAEAVVMTVESKSNSNSPATEKEESALTNSTTVTEIDKTYCEISNGDGNASGSGITDLPNNNDINPTHTSLSPVVTSTTTTITTTTSTNIETRNETDLKTNGEEEEKDKTTSTKTMPEKKKAKFGKRKKGLKSIKKSALTKAKAKVPKSLYKCHICSNFFNLKTVLTEHIISEHCYRIKNEGEQNIQAEDTNTTVNANSTTKDVGTVSKISAVIPKSKAKAKVVKPKAKGKTKAKGNGKGKNKKSIFTKLPSCVNESQSQSQNQRQSNLIESLSSKPGPDEEIGPLLTPTIGSDDKGQSTSTNTTPSAIINTTPVMQQNPLRLRLRLRDRSNTPKSVQDSKAVSENAAEIRSFSKVKQEQLSSSPESKSGFQSNNIQSVESLTPTRYSFRKRSAPVAYSETSKKKANLDSSIGSGSEGAEAETETEEAIITDNSQKLHSIKSKSNSDKHSITKIDLSKKETLKKEKAMIKTPENSLTNTSGIVEATKFMCDKCPKVCKTTVHLAQHKLIHNELKPFQFHIAVPTSTSNISNVTNIPSEQSQEGMNSIAESSVNKPTDEAITNELQQKELRSGAISAKDIPCSTSLKPSVPEGVIIETKDKILDLNSHLQIPDQVQNEINLVPLGKEPSNNVDTDEKIKVGAVEGPPIPTEGSYVCEICGKRCRKIWNFKQHIKIHKKRNRKLGIISGNSNSGKKIKTEEDIKIHQKITSTTTTNTNLNDNDEKKMKIMGSGDTEVTKVLSSSISLKRLTRSKTSDGSPQPQPQTQSSK